jgi:hypothetical protein
MEFPWCHQRSNSDTFLWNRAVSTFEIRKIVRFLRIRLRGPIRYQWKLLRMRCRVSYSA